MLTDFRKYIETFRLSFKMQIVWRFDLAMTALSTVARITAAWILWGAIYGGASALNGGASAISGSAGAITDGINAASNGASAIGGFSFGEMLSYYIIGSILSTIDYSYHISGEVSYLIRSGRFSGHMVTPMSPMGFFCSMTAGQTAYHLGFSAVAAAACAALFRADFTLARDPAAIALALAIIPLGLLFMAAYHFFIGVLTFKFLEIDFFLHVQGAILSFATGALVPLSLLPGGVYAVLGLLPFTHVVYTPAMLITGRMGAADGAFGLLVIIFWAAAMSLIAHRTYTKMRTAYDGVGI